MAFGGPLKDFQITPELSSGNNQHHGGKVAYIYYGNGYITTLMVYGEQFFKYLTSFKWCKQEVEK